ncbi:ABC transporter Cdr4 [Fistulina hepatica ATCC 64428]|uniref:ABC transporter Cdr4 n=1 Tax=Fistulina hepatica ATCC 64428 TaxID=1128425 RepID=A0A0D7AJW6_9AGAR|nr:ABC transporter Cdr4 [Fistulina hepatica ATCC 64428]
MAGCVHSPIDILLLATHSIPYNSQYGQVQNLARVFSRQSRTQSEPGIYNPFVNNSNPLLDPHSPEFSAGEWLRNLLMLASANTIAPHTTRTAGVSFRRLGVHGYGRPTDSQKDVGNLPLHGMLILKEALGFRGNVHRVQTLQSFDGLVKNGELLAVLGRPGSGCSTFLKTIAGETHGAFVDENSEVQYQGIPYNVMHSDYRGEVIYNAETETHFSQLTVGQTLFFAAKARAPRTRIGGITRDQYAMHMRDAIMAMYGLSHTMNTRVGNDFVRGVSGGERKRVSIAEASLSQAPIQCWDNSTRGLDSATANEFIHVLKLQAQYLGTTSLVSMYQASQTAYDLFDKVVVLYEGREIYFGSTKGAKEFFTSRGFVCAYRQTTGDFLTSLTNPSERVVASGWEGCTPRTPDEFAQMWHSSPERARLLAEIEEYNAANPINGENAQHFRTSRREQQSRSTPRSSPYTISVIHEVRICVGRGIERLRGNMSFFYVSVLGNTAICIIIASVFYNLPPTTGYFYSRGALIFFAILNNAFSSAMEILTEYERRPIVEKHKRYAFYHPASEAVASMIVDLPAKVIIAITCNLPIYWMTNLRREAGAFFIFVLFSFSCTLAMSSIFRTIAASARTLTQAMPPAALFILALVIYTGFTIPTRDMVRWFRWINYINPIGYAFESLMVNEFDGRDFECSSYIPSGAGYANATGDEIVCSAVGAVAGQDYVSGTRYIGQSFEYKHSHLWRNFAIIIGFWAIFTFTYLLATETISAKKSKGEVLVFRQGHLPKTTTDEESGKPITEKDIVGDMGSATSDRTVLAIRRQTKIFHWGDVCFDIKTKDGPRRLLDHVDGWVKPGTLTALMGVSGAGKTMLLDVLASRTTMGVITGEMLVNGHIRDSSFQRKTGYVQQQDLHLETSTVREALAFSALLRQPKNVPRAEKLAYVDEVIRLLEMEPYAEAVVGVPGEGLNVEQRKRLTIGIELVAQPELLIFFDEACFTIHQCPTSGLDSQTAWSICQLMRKLANNGQAILCTIHQPSAILMQEFDRLLFLETGGRPVYFGELGKNASVLINYFEKNGAPKCAPEANPAEWMFEVIGAAPGHTTDKDWNDIWRRSPEYVVIKAELAKMKEELSRIPQGEVAPGEHDTFAVSLWEQYVECYKRVWQQYWRTPSYIYPKLLMCIFTALFIGFSFYQADNSEQGLQNQMFAVFMLYTIFNNLVQQVAPQFVLQRSLYEARERPSKAYSWLAFMGAQITVEIPWQLLTAALTFFSWYYPIGLYRNGEPTNTVHERGVLMFLFIVQFCIFTSTFGHLAFAGIDLPEAGSNLASLCFMLCLLFCGVLAKATLGWWIWMYRVSPFTYFVSGMLSTAVAHNKVECAAIEYTVLEPPSGDTCWQYLDPYVTATGAYLSNPNATSECLVCPMSSTDQFLAEIGIYFDDAWRNFGILWVYIIFNIFASLFVYWLARVPKGRKAMEIASTPPAGPGAERSEVGKDEKANPCKT